VGLTGDVTFLETCHSLKAFFKPFHNLFITFFD
jgi:hypothetical protein